MFTFETKIKTVFQVDLNSDLKEEPNLKSSRYFTLFELVIPSSWLCLNTNLGKYALTCVTL